MKIGLRILGVLLLSCMIETTAQGQGVIFRIFPRHREVEILCWSAPDQRIGYLSQIIIIRTNSVGISSVLWQSSLDSSYSPQIRFVPEIQIQGLPLALVQRQTGAASSELDVIGKTANGFARLFHADGFKFDVARLDGGKMPLIIAHRDASILDVPQIYGWDGSRFVMRSTSYPKYYRKLLEEDRKTLPSDLSVPVLVNLAQVASLAKDRDAAKAILDDALAKERRKGSRADREMLHRITEELRATGRSSR